MVSLERGGAMGQRLHMQSWGPVGTGFACMEQFNGEGGDWGQELSKPDHDVERVTRLVRPSNTPMGRLAKA